VVVARRVGADLLEEGPGSERHPEPERQLGEAEERQQDSDAVAHAEVAVDGLGSDPHADTP